MKPLLFAMFGVLATGLSFSTPSSAQLSDTLSPVGAILAGNKEGTIPAWTGGIKQPPAGYKVGQQHPDPYAADPILSTITTANLDAYRSQLSDGIIKLMEKHPSFKVNVYPSHRSAALPERIYQSSIRNAQSAELAFRGHGVTGAVAGIPFPVPENGQQAIWNHTMRYRGDAVEYTASRTAVQPDGSYDLAKLKRQVFFNYGRAGLEESDLKNTLFFYKHKIIEPPRSAGTSLLLKETIDQVVAPRKGWQYYPDQRKVRRLPGLAYSDIMPDTSGMLTADTADMYNGALDKYDWELKGRQEFIVPYNSYKLHGSDVQYEDIIKPGTMNPDLLRYELHRVWVVEATLRTGIKHPYAKRRFYIDEDSWQILMVDIYNAEGELIHYQEAHPINYYEVPLVLSTAEVIYDLTDGRYFVDGLSNQEDEYDFSVQLKKRDFTSAGLRREGGR
ncbi:DUF1329 domain-containing protein [Parendozoicomonas haliclonae]|uniref:Outer membrane lipoprotein-sorting protein n=1 Tax=Parendozoicomonas haliclonae TaxID=1960125 RepID=A0A1X7AGF9_9GAMM|nr:DUF1329 domain-containing protein [Parendozoicomonas haliclonae]SMA38655.1 hypothetical protein EHSB41UT_00907 [Parendozoicomonas haliclonae]